MIEVLVALGILGFGLLSVAAMQIVALKDASKGRHVTAAAMIARDQIERVQRVPFSTLTPKTWGASETWMAGVGLTRGPIHMDVDEPGGTTSVEQTYSVDWRLSPVVPVNQDLMNIEVDVTWVEHGQTATRSFGISTIVVDNSR
jgi:Tfp pilus assembly protein PilV